MRRYASVLMVAAVVLSAGLVAGCSKTATTTAQPQGTTRSVQATLLVKEQSPEIAKAFRIGDTVKATATGVTVGTISSVQVTATPVPTGDAQGHLSGQPSPITVDIRVVCDQTVQEDANGYLFPGGRLYVGTDAPYLTSLVSFTATVLSIEPKAK